MSLQETLIRPSALVFRVSGYAACLALLLGLAGCGDHEPIRKVVVDADQSGIEFDDEEEAPKDGRMVVAIHEAPQSTWTLKISGELDLVNSTEDQWMDFFRKVRFEDETPQWELPEGWSKVNVAPGPFAPFARLQIADGLTLSVSRLPGGFDMLGNINRWRGQLSLPPAKKVDLSPITGESVTPFKMFDVLGLVRPGGMQPPFAGGMGGPAASAGPARSASGSPIEFTAPEGWTEGKSSEIVAARFSKTDGDATAQITVTQLPANLNQWEQVARNWAGETQLESLSADALEQRTKPVEVDSMKGNSIRLMEVDDEVTRGLIGVRVDDGRQAWFIKMAGDKNIVAASEDAFFQFVKSIRFK